VFILLAIYTYTVGLKSSGQTGSSSIWGSVGRHCKPKTCIKRN